MSRLIDVDKYRKDLLLAYDDVSIEFDVLDIQPIVKAIPLDKVKMEIKKKAFTEEIFDEDIFNSIYTENISKETAECESYVETEVVKMSDVLEILDKLIESEE